MRDILTLESGTIQYWRVVLSKFNRRIPRLPESIGRVGHLGAGSAVRHVIALGDSVAAGVGVERGADTIAGRLASRLADAGEPTSWAIHARGGLTADGVGALIDEDDVVSEDLARADVVVVSVGVNDLLRLRPLRGWRRDLEALLAQLRATTRAAVVLLGMPPMAAFPSLPGVVRDPLAWRVQRMDAIAVATAARYGVRHVPLPVDLLLTEGAFAPDGFHPSARSHDQLAGIVVSVLPCRTTGAADDVR